MYFNSNIKLMRKRRGRTQDEVAFALNMKRSTLSGYENEVAQPGIQQLIAYISSVMTLLPGDVILTGTPAGIGALQPGDVVEVDIEGIGILRNPVIADRH